MGHIKEPKGVDFVIASDPLTVKARKEFSDFILNYKKNKMPKNEVKSSTTKKLSKPSHV